jgi:hypothetical protein
MQIILGSKPISLRIQPDLLDQAQAEAKRRRLSFSSWIKMIMQDELDRQADKHPTEVTPEEKRALADGLKGE